MSPAVTDAFIVIFIVFYLFPLFSFTTTFVVPPPTGVIVNVFSLNSAVATAPSGCVTISNGPAFVPLSVTVCAPSPIFAVTLSGFASILVSNTFIGISAIFPPFDSFRVKFVFPAATGVTVSLFHLYCSCYVPSGGVVLSMFPYLVLVLLLS